MVPQAPATNQATTTGSRRLRAMALFGATGGLAAVVGQLVGGALVSADIAGTGWRPIFLVNVPIGIVIFVLATRVVPDSRSLRPAPIDWPGTVLLGATVLSLLVPLSEGRVLGWPLWSWLSLGATPFLLAAFVALERRKPGPGRPGATVPGRDAEHRAGSGAGHAFLHRLRRIHVRLRRGGAG